MISLRKTIIYPEYKYNLLAFFNYTFKYRYILNHLNTPKHLIFKSFITAIEDAKEYLAISTEEFFEYSSAWAYKEKDLFCKNINTNAFYKSWNGEYAKLNICANILNQHIDSNNYAILYNYISKHTDERGLVIDYGCGTATLSIYFAIEKLIKSKILLLDVDNGIRDFVYFRIKKHRLGNITNIEDIDKFNERTACDALYCIDVLEHLPNSSEIFTEKIHPVIKIGGLLYLKAPWRGQVTHLDSAADNFYKQGGRKLLFKKYNLICRSEPMDISCVFKKKYD
jgi:hypothetical protein